MRLGLTNRNRTGFTLACSVRVWGSVVGLIIANEAITVTQMTHRLNRRRDEERKIYG